MRIIVIGMNPSNKPTVLEVGKNSTFDKLNNWMTEAGVKHFSFMNCFDEQCDTPKMSMVDQSRFYWVDDDYRVLALGSFASSVLNRVGIQHHKLPHPSPRNRLFNDKKYEKIVIKQLKGYLK